MPRQTKPKNEALLTGRDATRAREAARTVGEALLAHPPKLGPDLATGNAGLAIVHVALERAFPGKGHIERAAQTIERAIAATERGATDPSLWHGFTGVPWTLEMLQGSDPDEPDDTVEDALLRSVARDWRGGKRTYDLTDGLCGLAVYALERAPRPPAYALLDAIVERLEETSERAPPGATWRSSAKWLPTHARDSKGAGAKYDLGLGHGVPGIVTILARTCAAPGVSAKTKRRARKLLDGAVAWLLAQELPRDAIGRFPRSVGSRKPREPEEPAHLGWSHGDTGIAAALCVAAQCTGEGAWLREATRIALAAAARSESDAGVHDASLCHGAAGVGHLLHRVYRATGEGRLADAARAWLMRAVALRSHDARYGWTSRYPTAGGRGTRQGSVPGVLFGAGGVILALLAATRDSDATWDRALGASAREPAISPGR